MKRLLRIALAVILGVCLAWTTTQAQTGKIRGTVTDAETGEPLPGVNIIIQGTDLGAATDEDGQYVIIQVPPGEYDVQASFIGYATQTMTGVRVFVDRTIAADFQLQQTAIAGQEVVVQAEREIVRPDVSYSQKNMTAQSIDELPAQFRLNDFLKTQAGVEVDNQGGLEIRGSGRTEINYMMDGLPLRNDRMDEGFTKVSKTSIEEVQLLTGSFNAEYGNARAGIVQVVTRSTQNRYFLNMDTRYSPLWGGNSDHPGLKHFGPYIFSDANWWEYGRYDWNNGAPSADKDGDGTPDFQGWNAWTAGNTFHGQALTPQQAFQVWQWQHRSEDTDGNVVYNDQVLGTIDELYQSPPTHRNPFNYYGYRGDVVADVSIGGPVPFTDNKLGFMISHVRENSMYPFPTSTSSVFKYNTSQLQLTYRFNPNMKLMASGLYSDQTVFSSGDPEPRAGITGNVPTGARTVFSSPGNVYNRDSGLVPKHVWSHFINLKWTHTIAQNTFYEIKAQQAINDFKQVGNARLRNTGNVYQVGPVWLDEGPKGWAYHQGDANDILDLFGLRGDRNSDLSWTRTWYLAGDVSSQINSHHQIKAGFEFTYKNIRELTGYTQNMQYFTDPAYRAGPDGKLGTADDGSPGDQANFHNVHVYPWMGAFYAQDKIEYGGMILNAGLRVDLHEPGSAWYDRNDLFYPAGGGYWDTHWERYGSNATTSGYTNHYGLPPDTNPPLEVTVSPRFGISHPIGVNSKIFFNYGHFYNLPPHDYMYRFQLGVDEPLEELGNPWMKMPRTIQFEAGWEQSFLQNFVATLSGYYKDVTRGVGSHGIEARISGGPSYAYNSVAQDMKGVELELRKRTGILTGFVNFEWRVTSTLDYGWDDIYPQESSQYREDPYLTNELNILDDQFMFVRTPGQWRAKVNLALQTPSNFGPGPMLAGATPLGNWSVSLYHQFTQGAAWTYNPLGLDELQASFNQREIDYNRTDLHVERRILLPQSLQASLYMDVSNLFNVKNLWTRDFGDVVSQGNEGEEQSRYLNYMNAIDAEGKRIGQETDNPYLMPQRLYYFWDAPRDIWLGIRLEF